MKDWLQKNSWSLAIAAVTLISTWTLYGYRITQLEKRVDINDKKITVLQESNNQAAIALAKIQKDIEYIRLQIDKIVK